MQPPLCSVVVPTMRRPHYLKVLLESALAQTYENIEILISQNGEDRESTRVVESAKALDKRVRMRVNPISITLPAHLNQCLLASRGEFIVIVSDDDRLSNNFVEDLVQSFLGDQDVLAAIPHTILIDERGRQTADLGVPPWKFNEGLDFLDSWLYAKRSVHAATFFSFLARRHHLLSIGGFPEFTRGSHTDNAALVALLLHGGKVAFAEGALFEYRVYGASYGLSQSWEELAAASAQFREYIVELLQSPSLAGLRDSEVAPFVKRGVALLCARTYLERCRAFRGGGVSPDVLLGGYQSDEAFEQMKAEYQELFPELRL